jgi:hypothetical protein
MLHSLEKVVPSVTGETFKLATYDDWHNTRLRASFPVTNDPIHAMALSADGRLLAIGNDEGNLEVYMSRRLPLVNVQMFQLHRFALPDQDGKE